MAIRGPAQDVFFITHQKTSISTTGGWTGSDIGLDTGDFTLVSNNKPDLLSGLEFDEKRKATGLVEKRVGTGYEHTALGKKPHVDGKAERSGRLIMQGAVQFYSYFPIKRLNGSPYTASGGLNDTGYFAMTKCFLIFAVPHVMPQPPLHISLLQFYGVYVDRLPQF